MSVEKWQSWRPLVCFSVSVTPDKPLGLCVCPCFMGEAVSLVDGYIRSGTRQPDFAPGLPADLGQVNNPSGPQCPHLICKMRILMHRSQRAVVRAQ